MGSTEGLLGSGAEIFDLVDRKSKIYKKKAVPSPVTFGMTVSAEGPREPSHEPLAQAVKEELTAKPPVDVQREADRLLLSKYVPSAVVVNENLEILQSRGRTDAFSNFPRDAPA